MKVTISSDQITDTAKTVSSAGRIAKEMKKSFGKQSLSRMSKDVIKNFPMVITSDIPAEYYNVLARASQVQYAMWLMSVINMRPFMNFDKYENFAEFLNIFHNNKDVDLNIQAALDGIGMESAITVDSTLEQVQEAFDKFEEEFNVSVELADMTPISSAVVDGSWDTTEESLISGKVNDIYLPYQEALHKIRGKVSAAMESISNSVNKLSDALQENDRNNTYDGPGGYYSRSTRTEKVNVNGKKTSKTVKDSKFNERNINIQGAKTVNTTQNLTELEPTMFTVNILVHGKSHNNTTGSTVFTYPLTLGVKVLPRVVRTDIVVANVISAVKDTRAIFKFIKWTKGEVKSATDILFGISKAKEKAMPSLSKTDKRLFEASRKRKKADDITKLLSNRTMPNLTVIISKYESEQIKIACGVDLTDRANVIKLMNKYYFLAFGIFDPETEVLQVFNDGDDDFTYATIKTLKTSAGSANKTYSADEIRKMGMRMD